MNSPRITYTPRRDATPEGESNALAAVYKFVLDSYARQEGGPATAPKDDVRESSEHAVIPNHNK